MPLDKTMKRSYLSGSEKRKRRKEEEEKKPKTVVN